MLATMCFKSTLCSLPLLVLVTVLLSTQLTRSMSLEKLCSTRCAYGRGGNLCNCNAFHFAGKRSGGEDENLHDNLAPLQGQNYRENSQRVNGGLGGSGSGFRSEGSRGGVAEDPRDDMVVEGFFGVEGHEKSAVNKLMSLLKAALDERLTSSNRKPREWPESSFPYATNDVVY